MASSAFTASSHGAVRISRFGRSSTTASPALASHWGDTKAPIPMRAMGSGTSVTSIGPSASAPQSSMVTPGCSTV